LDSIAEGDGMAFSEVLTTLRSLSSNVGDLSEKMTDLAGQMKTQQWMVPLIVTIALGVIAIIVALK
jgi:hypothetical protein